MKEFTGIGIHSTLMNRGDLKTIHKMVGALVAGICSVSEKSECRATNPRMAQMLGVSESTVAHAVSRLKKSGDFIAYGGRLRKLKTRLTPFDGAEKRTGTAPGIWIPRSILAMKATPEKKIHIALLYSLRHTQARPAEYLPHEEVGVHFQTPAHAAKRLAIGEKTIRDHRDQFLKQGIVEIVHTYNDYKSGYRLTDTFYEKITAGDFAVWNGDSAFSTGDFAVKDGDFAFLYKTVYNTVYNNSYDSELSFARRGDILTEEGEDTVSHTEEVTPTFTETPTFEEIRAPFHRDDERTGDEVSVAAQNTVSVVTADEIPQWIAEAIAPSERRQTHENALRAPRYIAPDFEYGSAEHTAWLDAHADELY